MAVNVPILVAIVIFYILIFVAGIWASRATKKRKSASESETLIVGAKDIGVLVGMCTMTATWYGGVAINGTAEAVYDPYQGLVWAISVPASGLSLIINGIVFAKRLREARYLTSLDPYETKYGKYSTMIFFVFECLGGIFYVAAILNALGGTLEVVAGIPRIPSVIVSAAVSVLYTAIGGFYSVAYTDVVQLIMMIVGLVLAIPFALTNEAVGSISETAYGEGGWIGKIPPSMLGSYIDLLLVVVLGTIPLQVVFQRVFSVKTTRQAQALCVLGGLLNAILMIPPVLIGAAGASTNWSMTDYMNGTGVSPLDNGNQRLILPAVLQYVTPTAVAFFGLGAVSAGVMSSMDSALLAVGSLFGLNIYQKIFRPKASGKEVAIVIRIAIILAATAGTLLALSMKSIMALYFLCADFTYVLTFPQFVSVLFLDPNMYGSIPALIVGLILRLGGGEQLLQWAAPFSYTGGANFPYKTVAMLTSFLTLNVFSYLAKILFQKGYISKNYDVFKSNLAGDGQSIYLNGIKPTSNESNTEDRELEPL